MDTCDYCNTRPIRYKKKRMCGACDAQQRRGKQPGSVRTTCKGKLCSVDNCMDEQYADEKCNYHWQRQRAGKSLERERNKRGHDKTGSPAYHLVVRKCRVNNCTRTPEFSDICERHRSLEKDRRRRSLKSAESLSQEELSEITWWENVLKNDPCTYCELGSDTVDHVRPIDKGGSFKTSNLVGACRSCNSSKRDTHLLQFLLRRTI